MTTETKEATLFSFCIDWFPRLVQHSRRAFVCLNLAVHLSVFAGRQTKLIEVAVRRLPFSSYILCDDEQNISEPAKYFVCWWQRHLHSSSVLCVLTIKTTHHQQCILCVDDQFISSLAVHLFYVLTFILWYFLSRPACFVCWQSHLMSSHFALVIKTCHC